MNPRRGNLARPSLSVLWLVANFNRLGRALPGVVMRPAEQQPVQQHMHRTPPIVFVIEDALRGGLRIVRPAE